MNFKRACRHLLWPHGTMRRAFGPAVLNRIEAAVAASETGHRGELCVVIERHLELPALWRGQSSRDRAHELFALHRVWDTADNSGVLVYVCWADRSIEIVADRGVDQRVGHETWSAICRRMETRFRDGQFEAGTLEGIAEITAVLVRHFPALPGQANPDELGNRPQLL